MRKPVSIFVREDSSIYVVCNDGSIWEKLWSDIGDKYYRWSRIEDVPQPILIKREKKVKESNEQRQ